MSASLVLRRMATQHTALSRLLLGRPTLYSESNYYLNRSRQTFDHVTKHPSLMSISPYSTQKSNSDPEIKAAPFSELGANRTVKIVVYICVAIIATIETVGYSTWLWRSYGPGRKADEAQKD